MIPIRQHIIALIQQYIYTNGEGKITAAQLKEILMEIANAFALNEGIDSVLEIGSTVSNGRVISNANNGAFKLEASETNEGKVSNYIGTDTFDPTQVGMTYSLKNIALTGVVKRNNASRSIFDIIGGEMEPGEMVVVTTHNIEEDEPSDVRRPNLNGSIYSTVRTKDGYSYDSVRGYTVETGVGNDSYIGTFKIDNHQISSRSANYINPDYSSRTLLSYEVNHYIDNGPQTSAHSHRTITIEDTVNDDNGKNFMNSIHVFGNSWRDHNSEIAKTTRSGAGIASEKRLTLGRTGVAPTAGVAQLASGGRVTVSTAAVQSNSVISITVQEVGTYNGQIRVASKTPNVGFSLSSTNDADNCTVFWQIINLE